MDSHTRASPNATGRHVEHRPGYSPTIMDAADDVLALVISKPYRTEAEAVAIAQEMANASRFLAALREIADDAEMLARFWEDTAPASSDRASDIAQRARDAISLVAEGQP